MPALGSALDAAGATVTVRLANVALGTPLEATAEWVGDGEILVTIRVAPATSPDSDQQDTPVQRRERTPRRTP